jgi:hypothetical protein
MCRKHHGTFHSTLLAAEKANFRFLQGEDAIVHYRSSDAFFERPFCKHCGSKVPDVSGEHVGIPAGSIEGDLAVQPRTHIFVAHKSPMESITDTLNRFDNYPPGFGNAVPAPENPEVHSPGVHGSCLCGDVAFVIDWTPTKIVQCHCSRCRRSRGTAHGVNTFVAQDKLRFTRGTEKIKTFRLPNASRYSTSFCLHCGSLLPSLTPSLGIYVVPVGSLDTPFQVQSAVNIYVASRANWFSITNPYPQFDELPPREWLADLLL